MMCVTSIRVLCSQSGSTNRGLARQRCKTWITLRQHLKPLTGSRHVVSINRLCSHLPWGRNTALSSAGGAGSVQPLINSLCPSVSDPGISPDHSLSCASTCRATVSCPSLAPCRAAPMALALSLRDGGWNFGAWPENSKVQGIDCCVSVKRVCLVSRFTV